MPQREVKAVVDISTTREQRSRISGVPKMQTVVPCHSRYAGLVTTPKTATLVSATLTDDAELLSPSKPPICWYWSMVSPALLRFASRPSAERAPQVDKEKPTHVLGYVLVSSISYLAN